MAETFFFYDLETSGINSRSARIMQFAGQRTDMNLQPVGEPYSVLIRLNEDVLPEPDAVMVTGITPQQTLENGIMEAEFFKLFCKEIVQPGTIFVGFNTIRFDDEFMRHGLYRNFYDAYEWQWKNQCYKWDMLDVVRMTRALRPEGINWPFTPDGTASNRLELLTAVNNLTHESAHDALSDVQATIEIAQMIREKQPKLLHFLFDNKHKKHVEERVKNGEPFLYVSGQYSSQYEKLAVVQTVGSHPSKQASFVYDLRYDPSSYLEMSVEQLVELWRYKKDKTAERLPVKTIQYNRCPAIAPMGVLRPQDAERLAIDMDEVRPHRKILLQNQDFYEKLKKASEILETEHTQTALLASQLTVDTQLYDGFIGDHDKKLFARIHDSAPKQLTEFSSLLSDNRLKALLPLYKARNFPQSLTSDERIEWEKHKTIRLQAALPKFMERLQALSAQTGLTKNQMFIIEELRLYAESIMPSDLG